jgi:hypothetical protein
LKEKAEREKALIQEQYKTPVEPEEEIHIQPLTNIIVPAKKLKIKELRKLSINKLNNGPKPDEELQKIYKKNLKHILTNVEDSKFTEKQMQ